MSRYRRLVSVLACACCCVSLVAADDISELEEQAMVAAVERVAPSVVQIETIGGLDRVDDVLVGDGPTTGLIVSEDGYIISSAFNFIRKPASILVRLTNGRRTPAEVVARDNSRMLVLLKVESEEPLAVPKSVPPEAMLPGQWSIAVGRTVSAESPNISVGILSATGRIWNKAIQTDAKVSPSNYGGPLVDLHGQVLGVLVPMSPNAQHEMAGAEWYDSGIGFAVPFADVEKQLDRLKSGEDLHPGLLGISLESADTYTSPAKIAAAQAKSPAREAGLKAGDTIVEIDGTAIATHAHLKHALGPRYAGETVRLVAMREDERVEVEIELTDKLIPYEHPFLGILPRRDSEGIVVRFVYPDSGAATAGVQAGDQIMQVGEEAVASAEEARLAIANLEPKQEASLVVQRADETKTLNVLLGSLPTDAVDSLPPSRAESESEAEGRAIDIKIAEEPNDCFAYLPKGYDASISYGVVLYLRRPGEFDREQLLGRWRGLCDDNDLILLAPQPNDPKRWTAPEVEFIRKTLDHVVTTYNVDKTRVVAYGREAGAAMAYLFTFRHRELVRGIVAIDGAPPRMARPPYNDPIYRLAVYTSYANASPLGSRVKDVVDALRGMKYPVTVKTTPRPGEPTDDARAEIVRWIDGLDRI